MSIILDGTNGIETPTYGGADSAEYVVPVTQFKNRIINGDMRIDQRNAGASVTPSDIAYSLDRWQARLSQTSKFSIQQNAGSVTPPAGFTNYLGVTSLSSYSVTSTDFFQIGQNIEGFNTADLGWGTANAQTITLSFWVRSSLTGTFGGSIYTLSGIPSYPFSYTINSANTWEYKTITIAGQTSGTWSTTNGFGLTLTFALGVGSSISGTANTWNTSTLFRSVTGATSIVGTNGATWYITGVQLEKGSTATSFDVRPYGTELALCQRYYYQQTSGTYSVSSTTNGSSVVVTIPFPVTMRATPTVTNPFTNALYDNAGPAAGKWSFNQPFIANMTKTGTVSIGATAQNTDNMQLPFYGATFSAQPVSINNNGLTVTANAEL